jgi:hypothetical protein
VNGEALAAYSSPDPKAQKLAAKTNPKFVALDKITPYKDITTYNNLLRVRHRQSGSRAQRRDACGRIRGR